MIRVQRPVSLGKPGEQTPERIEEVGGSGGWARKVSYSFRSRRVSESACCCGAERKMSGKCQVCGRVALRSA